MKNTALLIIDIQNSLMWAAPFGADEFINNIKRLIKSCRENNIPVIYIQHNGEIGGELDPNSKGWEIFKDIAPTPKDIVITKDYNSAFKETNLKKYLNDNGINELIITGMQTEYCIDTNCKVAFEYGFKVIIPEKTNTTFNDESMLAEDIYNFYNFNIFNNRFATVESVEDTIKRIKS